jgi:addiction module HigA family antidote
MPALPRHHRRGLTEKKPIRIRTHPGEVLREEYLKPLGMSARALAEAIGVPANRLSEIVRERRGITADTALRLGRYFGTEALFWINLQVAHDLSKAEAETDYSRIPTRAA